MKTKLDKTGFIDHQLIYEYLKNTSPPDKREVRDILEHAKELNGISFKETEKLLLLEDENLLEEVFDAADYIKNEIYGKRLVLFAPLYVSNICKNECLYCAFRSSNKLIKRRRLTLEEIKKETEILTSQGHKRILLVSGEGREEKELDYVIKAIETIYNTKVGNGEIRRINVNIAPLDIEGFKRLKSAKIGTYQLFQETYHYPTYKKMHLKGPKSDYLYHLTTMDRAFESEIDDVGIGILFGLYDYKFEIMAMLQHIRHLEEKFGLGPHTISVPRIEPATGSEISQKPPHAVTDRDFKKIIAILRITVPYTGIILSTRENPEMRREAFRLGVSQISAGSRTNPGGYSEGDSGEQFSLGDHRPIDEVIYDICKLGYIPSFCTSCYRLGRTGIDFMDLAKPGLIKEKCLPNGILTFKEYLLDYGSPKTREIGEKLISQMVSEIKNNKVKNQTLKFLQMIENGKRDIYC